MNYIYIIRIGFMIKADGWVLLQLGHKLEIHNVLLGACVSVTMDVYVIPYVNYAKFALVHLTADFDS